MHSAIVFHSGTWIAGRSGGTYSGNTLLVRPTNEPLCRCRVTCLASLKSSTRLVGSLMYAACFLLAVPFRCTAFLGIAPHCTAGDLWRPGPSCSDRRCAGERPRPTPRSPGRCTTSTCSCGRYFTLVISSCRWRGEANNHRAHARTHARTGETGTFSREQSGWCTEELAGVDLGRDCPSTSAEAQRALF